MSHALTQFRDNLHHARHVLELAAAIEARTSDVVDTDDLFRAALVAGVSALDHYIHEIVRELMIEIADDKRSQTAAFRKFSVTMGDLMKAADGVPAQQWMDEAVRNKHGHLTFQQPDKIADAIRLVWIGELWPEVAAALDTDASSIKRQIALIVDRRNRIVHEADRDPTPPHLRWPINDTDVQHSLSTIEKTVITIDKIL